MNGAMSGQGERSTNPQLAALMGGSGSAAAATDTTTSTAGDGAAAASNSSPLPNPWALGGCQPAEAAASKYGVAGCRQRWAACPEPRRVQDAFAGPGGRQRHPP